MYAMVFINFNSTAMELQYYKFINRNKFYIEINYYNEYIESINEIHYTD